MDKGTLNQRSAEDEEQHKDEHVNDAHDIYETINEEGPAHDKTFTVEVKIDDIVYGTGIGNSKKEAEQEAAKEALDKVVK